jgi:hypothetical protein
LSQPSVDDNAKVVQDVLFSKVCIGEKVKLVRKSGTRFSIMRERDNFRIGMLDDEKSNDLAKNGVEFLEVRVAAVCRWPVHPIYNKASPKWIKDQGWYYTLLVTGVPKNILD